MDTENSARGPGPSDDGPSSGGRGPGAEGRDHTPYPEDIRNANAKEEPTDSASLVDTQPDVTSQPTEGQMPHRAFLSGNEFPRSKRTPGLEFAVEFDHTHYDMLKIDEYAGGGCAFTSGYDVNRNDELFIKSVQHLNLEANTDFEMFAKQFVANASVFGVSNRIFKITFYNHILDPHKHLIQNMVPLSPQYLTLTAEEYINCIRVKLCPVVERKVLRRQFEMRKQGRDEPLKYFYLDKQNLYARAYPVEQRDIHYFIDKFIRSVVNPHIKKYFLEHVSEIDTEPQFQQLLSKGMVFVSSGMDAGLIPKSEGYGLDNQLVNASYRNQYRNKEHVNTIDVASGTNSESEVDERGEVNEIKKFNTATKYKTRKSGQSSGNTNREECFYCGKTGHWRKECLKRKKDFGLINTIPDTISDSEQSTDSDINELEQLMAVNQISKKTGRRIIKSLARKKPRKPYRGHQEVGQTQNSADTLRLVNSLEEKVSQLQNTMDSFLERSQERKRPK